MLEAACQAIRARLSLPTQVGLSASKFLIPLSYASELGWVAATTRGQSLWLPRSSQCRRWSAPVATSPSCSGIVTLIGTSTNLVVSGLAAKKGIHFKLFDLAPMGKAALHCGEGFRQPRHPLYALS